MAESDVKRNTIAILNSLKNNAGKFTQIAKAMGYTTTAQLHSVMSGESLISTKAVISLIENLNVNPTFLFCGTGEMFLSETNEVDELRNKVKELTTNHDAALKTIMELTESIKKLEKRNADLIDISAAAIEYFKEHKGELLLTEGDKKNPLDESIEMFKRISKKKGDSSVDDTGNSSMKQKK